MYTAYFGLREKPFSIAPDPRYLYVSTQHQEAIAHLRYGLQSDGGFVLLTGEVGAGKTTVCRHLLEEIPELADIAVIFNPKLTVLELLETVCDELHITRPAGASVKVLIDHLNAHLLEVNAAGRKTVLIIDEAQSLSPEVLEQLRLLTNLETSSRKLLQIILLGQPELRTILGRPEMRQLAQRITASYHLGPLSCEDVRAYVRHRLAVAGCARPIFPPAALRMICRYSGGVPRLINLLCDRALLGAFTRDQGEVTPAIIRQAAREALFETRTSVRRSRLAVGLAALLVLGGLLAGLGSARFAWFPELLPFSGDPAPQPPLASKPAVVQVVPPAPPAAAAPLPAEWPAGFAAGRSAKDAFADLALLWGVTAPSAAGDPCAFAESMGLRCLSRQDSLTGLQNFNRPAVLTLYADDGKPFHAVLAELDGQRARFVVGGEVRDLDVSILESRWFGEFLLLWKPPGFYTAAIGPGGSGPAIPWLAGTLEALGLYGRHGGEDRLDGQLLGALKRYQLSAGLVPDGALGPQTVISLLNALGHERPLLNAKEARN